MTEDRPRDLLGMTREDRIWTFGLLGGGGLVLLAALPWLLELLSGFPFIPFEGVAEWVSGFDAWWAPYVRGAAGLALGLVGAALVVADERRLEVGDDDIVVARGSDRRVLRRDQVVGIHVEGKTITIDGDHGRTLFDAKVDASRARVRAAFRDRGWPFESE